MMRNRLCFVGLAFVMASGATEVRRLTNTISKTNGAYPTSWAAQAPFWEGGIAPQSGCAYLNDAYTLRVPATSVAGTYPFPGDSLTISNATLAFSMYQEPAVVTFSDLLFACSTASKSAVWANYTPGTYFLYQASKPGESLRGKYSVMDGKVTVGDIGVLKVTVDKNMGCGTKWTGTLLGGDTADVQIKGVTEPIDFWGQAHHFRLESNTDKYTGKFTVYEKSTFTTRGLANGSIVAESSGILQPLEIAEDALTVKNLTLKPGAAIAIPVSSATGLNGSIKVTDTYVKNAGAPVIVTLTNAMVTATTANSTPPTKLKILTVPAASTLTADQFIYYGVMREVDYFLIPTTSATMGTFSVETDAAAGTKTLYLTIKRHVDMVVSQSGDNFWPASTNWSDNLTPDAEGDYFTNGRSLRMMGSKDETFPGHSLTLNSLRNSNNKAVYGSIQIRSVSNIYFPNTGLVFEEGYFYNYCGSSANPKPLYSPICGNVYVTSATNKPVFFDPVNNPFRGFNFVAGYTFQGTRMAYVVLKGSYASKDDRTSCMHSEFRADTTAYKGIFDVRTNAVLALGAYGLPQGTVWVTGGTHKPAAGAVSTVDATTSATISNLTLQSNAAIEVVVDPTTGANGKLRVSGTYTQKGKVQVFLSDYPKRTLDGVGEPNWNYDVLTLAAGAGQVNADDFEFAGIISGNTRRLATGAFEVVSDATTGDKTLVFKTAPNGGLVIIFK